MKRLDAEILEMVRAVATRGVAERRPPRWSHESVLLLLGHIDAVDAERSGHEVARQQETCDNGDEGTR
jgi:hypothetical protein